MVKTTATAASGERMIGIAVITQLIFDCFRLDAAG